MTDASLLSVTDLGRRFGNRTAVAGVSLEVQRGMVLGLLGLNGAGKTTTLRMLCGCLAPTTGRILIDGIDLLEEPVRAKAKLGYLPETPPLQDDATVRDFLHWVTVLRRMPRRSRRQAVDRVMQRCGLTATAGRLIRNLSRGYQQRVGIAQALVHEPPLVILDEPTVSLDPAQVTDVRALIEGLRADHAVILSSHILSEVQALCSHVTVFHRGRQIYTAEVAAAEDARHYRLVLAAPPAASELEAVPGVASATPQADGTWMVELASGAAVEDLASAAASHGWRLRELTPRPQTVEQVFLDLTRGDGEVAA